MNKLCIMFLVTATVSAVQPLHAETIKPFEYFSVYSLGDIGSTASRFQADFDGAAGAGGDVWLTSSSIMSGSSDSYAMHAGGDFSVQWSGIVDGHVDAGGSIGMNGVTVTGNLYAGGDIYDYGWGNAMIGGSANAGGNVALSSRATVQASHSGVAYEPQVNHQAVSEDFRQTSEQVGNMAAMGSISNQYGKLVFVGSSGVNVVEVDQQTLRSAWGFTIIAPADAVVLINVLDTSVTLDSTTWEFQGGIEKEAVLLNMANAVTLALSQTNGVNILAPLASTQFQQGTVDGFLVVGNLYGGGQVSGGAFTGAIPEPVTSSLLAAAAMLLLRRRRTINS
jgi:choice-of-anchor A domain-containing protein